MNTDTNKELVEMVRDFVKDIDACGNGEKSIFEYLDGDGSNSGAALSIEYFKINTRGECVGGQVCLTWGGPNIYADEYAVRGYWGVDRFEMEYTSEGRAAMMEYFQECASCVER